MSHVQVNVGGAVFSGGGGGGGGGAAAASGGAAAEAKEEKKEESEEEEDEVSCLLALPYEVAPTLPIGCTAVSRTSELDFPISM